MRQIGIKVVPDSLAETRSKRIVSSIDVCLYQLPIMVHEHQKDQNIIFQTLGSLGRLFIQLFFLL